LKLTRSNLLSAGLLTSSLVFTACDRPAHDTAKSDAVGGTEPVERTDSANQSGDRLGPLPTAGPRLVIDSSGGEPRLEARETEYVVHIPLEMWRVLNDSLPGFSPVQISTWHPGRVARIASESKGAALPSLVMGDFNGDSRLDVALAGKGLQRGASVILLARSAPNVGPRLFFISGGGTADTYLTIVRPQRIIVDPELEAEPLDLRNDAVLSAIVDKAAVIYYLDNGVLREYTTSD
jgi:hypothetical protein